MAPPILYSFRRCPYAMRARLALQASGVEVELREILLRNKPQEMLLASSKGTVPVLVLADGQVIEQSLDIMLWALRQGDERHWLPADPSVMEDALQCIAANDGPFKQSLDRYKYPARFALTDGVAHREAGAAFLRQLAERLSENRYLHGAHWGLLDAAIAPFVRQFAHTDPMWFAAQDWPQLAHWLQRFEESYVFQGFMEKVPPWQPGDPLRITRFAVPDLSLSTQ
jgi:glutathione S-transferase